MSEAEGIRAEFLRQFRASAAGIPADVFLCLLSERLAENLHPAIIKSLRETSSDAIEWAIECLPTLKTEPDLEVSTF